MNALLITPAPAGVAGVGESPIRGDDERHLRKRSNDPASRAYTMRIDAFLSVFEVFVVKDLLLLRKNMKLRT